MSLLSKKYRECVRKGKACEPAEPIVNFSGIDKAMEKLEREELEAEAAIDAAHAQAAAANEVARVKQSKLRRIRQQRKFLKSREQKMFDKGLEDVEELERLEELEKSQEVGIALASSSSMDEFMAPGCLSPPTFDWLNASLLPDETAAEASGSPSSS